MCWLLSSLLLFANPQIDPVEIQSVLEWDIKSPSSLAYDRIETIATAALESEPRIADATRQQLLLRRGVIRLAGAQDTILAAVKDLQESHRLAPDDLVAHCYRIMSESAAGHYRDGARSRNKAEREVEGLIAMHRDKTIPRLTLTTVLENNGQPPDYGRILALLEECLEIDPDYTEAHARKAYCLWSMHDYASAVDSAKRARNCPLTYDPRLQVGLFYLEGLVRLEGGQFSAALPALSATARSVPDRVTPREPLWICLSCLGRSNSAESLANEMIERFPQYENGYIAKAMSLSLRGDHEKARETAEKIGKLEPQYANHFLRGWLTGRLSEAAGEVHAAVAGYESSLEQLKSGNGAVMYRIDARLRLALLRAAAPDKDVRNAILAKDLAEQLLDELDESPVRRLAYLVLACAHAENGDFEDAIEAVNAASQGIGVTLDETNRAAALKRLFAGEKPYRLGDKDPAQRLVEIPPVACCFGPLKRTDLQPKSGLTLPDE